MQDRFFTRDGVRLRYRDEGQGPAVMWLHGWTLDLQMWDLQTRALSNQFRLIRLDRRGFGLSSGRPSVEQDVEDLTALCGLLGLERMAFVGMSQGARAAVAFAQVRPTAVSCLVLDGPPDFDLSGGSELPLAHYRELVRSQGMEAFRQEWRRHPLARLQTDNHEVRDLLAATIARYRGLDLLEPPSAAAAVPAAAGIDSLQVPVLILQGDHESPGRAAAAMALAARLPDARRVVIDNAGHMPNLDNPDSYNAQVRAFLARHAGGALTG
ncbi:MAG TPA: alpha/beta hydrolase [Steroidobacteraceae bacterium]|nr:alpha/beta hydrolase [Steroidobacteraceae bacterium]